jgi:hypothetical protein
MTMHPPLQITFESPSDSSPRSSFDCPTSTKQDQQKPQDSNNNIASRKQVTWSKRVTVKKIRSHNHYADEEVDGVWYSPEDYITIKKGCIQTLKLMHKPDFQENDQYSARGLEIRTRQAARKRKEIKTFAAQAVLDEQELQDETGETDPERVREVYRETSSISQSQAQFMGMRDQEAVKDYLKEERPSNRGNSTRL